MSGIARRATALIREMLSQDGGVSPYNVSPQLRAPGGAAGWTAGQLVDIRLKFFQPPAPQEEGIRVTLEQIDQCRLAIEDIAR
jgi:hypothetical protein